MERRKVTWTVVVEGWPVKLSTRDLGGRKMKTVSPRGEERRGEEQDLLPTIERKGPIASFLPDVSSPLCSRRL
jgi:hypothetical protein